MLRQVGWVSLSLNPSYLTVIAERLAQADPGNAGWQRDLSVSYDRIGDVLEAQGNLPEALKSFRDGLAIRERLASAKGQTGAAVVPRDLRGSVETKSMPILRFEDQSVIYPGRN